jgi:hypothetical protein
MNYSFLPVILFFMLFGTGQIYGQSQKKSAIVTDQVQKAAEQATLVNSIYNKKVYDPKEIINGTEYLPYFYRSNTTPLIFNGKELNSVLFMNGRKYDKIKLQYDTFLDEVVYTDTSLMINYQFPKIALNEEIVQGFDFAINFDSLKFRYIRFSDKNRGDLSDGFFEVAYDGKSSLIIQHRSKQYRSQAVYEYEYSPVKYVSLGNAYTKVKNNKDFLLMFGNYSPEIKEFMKNSRIRIRMAGKKEIIMILKYYDSLQNS